jgi:hypothetical protein
MVDYLVTLGIQFVSLLQLQLVGVLVGHKMDIFVQLQAMLVTQVLILVKQPVSVNVTTSTPVAVLTPQYQPAAMAVAAHVVGATGHLVQHLVVAAHRPV